MDDEVEEAVVFEKFAALEAVGELDFDRVPDGARAGKANEGFWLGDNEIAQHGKAGGDAARGGIRQQADEKLFGVVEAGEGSAGFGHLHQGKG